MPHTLIAKITVPTIVVLIFLMGCGGTSVSVTQFAPTTDIVPYTFSDSAANIGGIKGLSGKDGTEHWQAKIGYSTSLIVGNVAYALTAVPGQPGQHVVGVRISDGHILWDVALPDDANSYSLGADPMTIAISAGDNGLYALNAVDGSIRWHKTIAAVYRPYCIGDVVLYINSSSMLVAVRASDGSPLWEHPVSTQIVRIDTGDQVIFADSSAVYEMDTDGNVSAFQLTTGQRLWHAEVDGNSVGLSSRMLLVQGASLSALALQDGHLLWTQPTPSFASHSLVGTDLIAVADANVITVHKVADGSVVWHKSLDSGYSLTSPLLMNNVLFIYAENIKRVTSPGCPPFAECLDYIYALNVHNGQQYWDKTLSDGSGFPMQA